MAKILFKMHLKTKLNYALSPSCWILYMCTMASSSLYKTRWWFCLSLEIRFDGAIATPSCYETSD